MSGTLRAVLWDVDGTMAETERDGHRVAFNEAFDAVDLPWHWDVPTYGRLLDVAGGRERLIHWMRGRHDAPADDAGRDALARRVHATKDAIYGRLLGVGGIAWRPGVRRLVDECTLAGVVQGIATTTSRANVAALMAPNLGPTWANRFRAIVCADDARPKKPDPLVYRIVLERLGIDAGDAVAIEDSPNGLAAAHALGIPVLVTRSAFFRERAFDGAAAICDDLDSTTTWAGGTVPRVDVGLLAAIVSAAA